MSGNLPKYLLVLAVISVFSGMAAAQISTFSDANGNLVFENRTGGTIFNITQDGGVNMEAKEIRNFFSQNECASNEAIGTINPDGSYECNSISTTTEAEGLSEILAVNNTANQSVDMSSNNLTEVGYVNPGNQFKATDLSLDGGLAVHRNADMTGGSVKNVDNLSLKDNDVKAMFVNGPYLDLYDPSSDETVRVSDDAYHVAGAADFGGDGEMEIAYSNRDFELVFMDKEGNKVYPGISPYPDVALGGVGDIDGDNNLDVAYANSGYNLSYGGYDGDSSVFNFEVYTIGDVVDIDNDGDQDILFEEDSDSGVKYIDDSGNKEALGVKGTPGGAGDIDEDGDLEVAYIEQSDGESVKFVDLSGDVVDTNADAESGGIGGVADFDQDEGLEIAYVKKDTGTLAFVDSSGNVQDTGADVDPFYLGVEATTFSSFMDVEGGMKLAGSLDMKENDIISTAQGNVTVGQDLKVEGDVYSEGADLAEVYSAEQDYRPGTVVKVSDGEKEVEATEKRFDSAVGVVSTDPGQVLNYREEGELIALAGKVPVRVSEKVEKGERVAAGKNGKAFSCDTVDATEALTSNASNAEIVESLKQMESNRECLSSSFGAALEDSENGMVEVKLE